MDAHWNGVHREAQGDGEHTSCTTRRIWSQQHTSTTSHVSKQTNILRNKALYGDHVILG